MLENVMYREYFPIINKFKKEKNWKFNIDMEHGKAWTT